MNHKHQRTEYYAGGRVPVPPRAQWWRGDNPADPTPAERPTMPSPEITRLLAELETVLATAEEIRYRIRVALGRPEPAQPNQPAAVPSAPQAPPRESPPPASKPTKALDTSTLTRTGRGLWAWAREFGHCDAIADLGRQAGFPARTVDWSPTQVDDAVGALEQLLAGTGSIPPATAPKPDHRIRKPRTDRVYDPGVDDLPY